MRTFVTASLFVLAAPLCLAQNLVSSADSPSGPTAVPKKPISFDASAIDKTADPCTDFFQYACGNWNKANPIPADQVRWGRFNELAEYNNYLLYNELKAAADAPKDALQRKYGDYFAACMNTELVDKLGVTPLQPELALIEGLKSNKDLAALNLALFKEHGGGELLGVGVGQDQKDSSKQILNTGQGGLSLPDRDYYLNPDARFVKIRAQYVDHVTKMFVLLGDTPEKAATEANDVMRIEVALAKGSMDRVELRDPDKRYHPMTIAEMQKLTPDYNWPQFLSGIGMGSVPTVNVGSPGFFTTVNTVLDTESLSALKSYLRWHTLHSAAPLLSEPFQDENFAFFSATLNGQKEQQPRWKRCTRMTDGALGEAVGQDWVKQNFPPDAKNNMENLVHALEAALAQDIAQLPWMSPETKVEAKKKLDAIRDKIGYPEHWRDYSKLTVKRDDLLGNVERNGIFEYNRNLSKYGKPVDETEWGMTPPTVNAYYNPPQNDINFPAGILQPPFFDNAKDPAVNFGAIGVVIGHEMTHGFDDQGRQFDAEGKLRDWWTQADAATFKERANRLGAQYSSFQPLPAEPAVHVNGALTMGENIADLGGLTLALDGYHTSLHGHPAPVIDGLTGDQRVFLGWAQAWRGKLRDDAIRKQVVSDPHSPRQFRVNGVVRNIDAWYAAFDVKPGDKLYVAPKDRVHIW